MASRNMEEFINKQNDDLNALEGDIRDRFKKLNEDIRSDFNDNLNSLISGDLRRFRNDLAKSITTAGLSFLEPSIDDAFGEVSIGSDFNKTLNRVVRKAVNSALDNAINGVFGSTKTTSSETERSLESARLSLSSGQQAALAAKQLKKGSKNL